MKLGKKIIIKVNGQERETIIDEHGVQRFPEHDVIRFLLGSAGIDMNKLCILAQEGKISEDDYRFIYQNIGYSVCGYMDHFLEDEIENPLWDD